MHIPGLFSSWLVWSCKDNAASQMKIMAGSSWWWWKADDLLNSRLLVSTELWCSERQVLTQVYHCRSSDKALPHPHKPPDTALELTVHQTLLCPLVRGAEVKLDLPGIGNLWFFPCLIPEKVIVITLKLCPPASWTHSRTNPQLYFCLTLLWKTGLECLCLSAQYEFSALQYI